MTTKQIGRGERPFPSKREGEKPTIVATLEERVTSVEHRVTLTFENQATAIEFLRWLGGTTLVPDVVIDVYGALNDALNHKDAEEDDGQ